MPIFKLNALLVVFWIVICAAYLAVLNDITVNGYRMKKVEDNLLKLRSENNNLSFDISDKQSIEGVAAKVKDMDMEDAGSVIYLDMPVTAVVKK